MEIFKSQAEYINSDFHNLMVRIIGKKYQNINLSQSRLRDIKDFATEIIKRGYIITKEKEQNQIIHDQFLDSPYFNFMAEVWDSELSKEIGNVKNLTKLANKLIETGFAVTKQ
jgi:hypothetical protein